MQIDNHLGLEFGGNVEDLLPSILLDPVRYLMDRPGKKLRGKLVRLGSEFGTKEISEDCIRTCEIVLESLHAGSLAIDDIQDDSRSRRGQPTLHRRYGTPIAINVGNWLYFKPMEAVSQLGLAAQVELSVYRKYHRTLLLAHYGQAIDIGVPIDELAQERVRGVCLSSLELKSGALTSFALGLGAIVAEAKADVIESVEQFGRGFGIGLQMYDDLGNLSGKKDPEKKWEDLRHRRPSWFWAHAADSLSPQEYKGLLAAVRALPKEDELTRWLLSYDKLVVESRDVASAHLEKLFADLGSKTVVPETVVQELRHLADTLRSAYV